MSFEYLIVSSLTQQKIIQDKLCLYLGKWCLNYSEKLINKKSIVLDYHWNDRQKLRDDFFYLDNLYELVLQKITPELNRYHQKKYPALYWRRIIGPWLLYFIHILFDRWFMLDLAIKKYKPKKCLLTKNRLNTLVPRDFNEFNNFLKNDEWNEEIFRQILSFYKDEINIVDINPDNKSVQKHPYNVKILKRYLLEKLTNIFSRSISKFNSNDKYFLYKPYLGKNIFKLNFLLNQIPNIWAKNEIGLTNIEISRKEFRLNLSASNKFESLLGKIIIKNLPYLYLEGFNSIINSLDDLRWPKKTKKIITAAAIWDDDFFKIWAAEKCLQDSKLIILQHGGLYGTSKLNSIQDHELKIADEFFSWGWVDKRRQNVKPVGNYLHRRNIKYSKKGNGLLVQASTHRMSYVLNSWVISSQWLNYHRDQIKFFDSLPQEIQNEFVVRLYTHDYGWQQEERWKNLYPNINIDNGKKNIIKQIKNCRIYISTYNATTFLESMSYNVPTLIFWDPKYWELSDIAEAHYKKLEDVGIFHRSPESAAQMVEKVWKDIDIWWFSPKVQKAKDNFIEIYSNQSNSLSYLAKIISS